MASKNIFALFCLLALASQAYSRSVLSRSVERNSDVDLLAQPSRSKVRISNLPQGRVIPGAIAAKKLLLLKLKKLTAVSFILLRSENGEEAELVPVYESSLIPSNVEFISTPGGISGHEDVQAIAIPADLANKNEIAAALQLAPSSEQQANKTPVEDDEPLDMNEDDDQQILLDAIKPTALRSSLKVKDSSPFEETSLYLYPYQENRGTKQGRRNLNRYSN